jgi:hypothetical protein
VNSPNGDWDQERRRLLGRRISDLGLRIAGSPVERLVHRLYDELEARGLAFRPPVYLSDEWGCPDGTPLIAVPFYLADPRLARIEAERSQGLEDEAESMEYMRHEAGHAINYAYRLYDRADWRSTFGPYSRPYLERYHADPFSREYVRHVLGWYAQKHPDEDFAETFAVWLTPDLDWRKQYANWPALRKLEYVDAVMREIGQLPPAIGAARSAEDLPVESIHFTVEEYYRELEAKKLPIEDEHFFDGDLRNVFAELAEAPEAPSAAAFIRSHDGELVSRIAYWSGEHVGVVRAFVDFLASRAEALGLRLIGFEASTLIELTAFGTAVMMNYRYTDAVDGSRGSGT